MTLPIVSVPTGLVSRRSTKRSFDHATKRRVVAEWESLDGFSAERGSLLRREGIVRRQVYEWRQALNMKPTEEPKRGPGRPPKPRSLEAENQRLLARNRQLEAELLKNEKMLLIMGKAHALLEALSESAATDTKPTNRQRDRDRAVCAYFRTPGLLACWCESRVTATTHETAAVRATKTETGTG